MWWYHLVVDWYVRMLPFHAKRAIGHPFGCCAAPVSCRSSPEPEPARAWGWKARASARPRHVFAVLILHQMADISRCGWQGEIVRYTADNFCFYLAFFYGSACLIYRLPIPRDNFCPSIVTSLDIFLSQHSDPTTSTPHHPCCQRSSKLFRVRYRDALILMCILGGWSENNWAWF